MNLKKMVGYKAAEFIEDGMTVGLGTGSTAFYMVEALGRRVEEEGLKVTGVTTSHRTTKQASELGIPLKDIDEVDSIDLTIDGADEISEDFQGIKGGGAAHLFEKMVADLSDEVIWIVDESKMVKRLGAFPLPVEVVKFGHGQVKNLFERKGLNPQIRLDQNGQKVETDSGNYVIDLKLEIIEKPHELAAFLDSVTGVVEHGLFLDCVSKVIVGKTGGPEVIEVMR
ncbi:ribose-5-phosphate isomerase RpiA [Alkalibacterium sp. AK22]|uniref:ribose-5-phosphate isomerase RpiA n=1 Tax=Alkalibacterium sp. AK22 TaxID=1229520 RepID=UPI00055022A5|nr:ribose-5-phosphate isomerase RpiA [Alkalibacterium sp. AK22]